MALDDGRLVSNLVVQALTGCSMTLYGDGSQTRSLCYVDDLIEGLVRLMESPPELCQPVNLGNPAEITVLHMARLVLELTKSSSPLQFHELPQDDPMQRCPDITLARERLDWNPTTSLATGLARTIEYFRRRTADRPTRAAAAEAQ